MTLPSPHPPHAGRRSLVYAFTFLTWYAVCTDAVQIGPNNTAREREPTVFGRCGSKNGPRGTKDLQLAVTTLSVLLRAHVVGAPTICFSRPAICFGGAGGSRGWRRQRAARSACCAASSS